MALLFLLQEAVAEKAALRLQRTFRHQRGHDLLHEVHYANGKVYGVPPEVQRMIDAAPPAIIDCQAQISCVVVVSPPEILGVCPPAACMPAGRQPAEG